MFVLMHLCVYNVESCCCSTVCVCVGVGGMGGCHKKDGEPPLNPPLIEYVQMITRTYLCMISIQLVFSLLE